jgi:hypothetical protein
MDGGWKQPHGWVDGVIPIVAIIVALFLINKQHLNFMHSQVMY